MTSARKPRVYVTQPVAKSAIVRLREVTTVAVNPDASRIIGRRALIAAVRRCDILFCLLHDQIDAGIISANPALRLVAAQSITPSNIDVEAATARGIPVTVVPASTTEATADLAFALMLADQIPWHAVYQVLALVMAAMTLVTLFSEDPDPRGSDSAPCARR